jgi:hypothetical protein
LTVVVLLSLAKNLPQREYKIAFTNAHSVDEHAELHKVATAAKKKSISITRLEVTRQCHQLVTTAVLKQKIP